MVKLLRFGTVTKSSFPLDGGRSGWGWTLNQSLRLLLASLLPILLLCILFLTATHCHAELQLEGDFTQGGLIKGRAGASEQVIVDGRKLQLTEKGDFILGFGRDAQPEQRISLIRSDGSEEVRNISVQQRRYKIERIDGISKRMMQPSPDDLVRIKQEAKLVAEVRRKELPLDNFQEDFIWPLRGRISGVYGSQRIFNGEPRRPHFGIDIAAPTGTPVIAPAGGRVTMAHAGMFFSGATLIIDHGHGLSSSFLHLDRIQVKEGDQIVQGQQIATVGASGRVTGPHLDWRINWFDRRLDPELLVPPMP